MAHRLYSWIHWQFHWFDIASALFDSAWFIFCRIGRTLAHYSVGIDWRAHAVGSAAANGGSQLNSINNFCSIVRWCAFVICIADGATIFIWRRKRRTHFLTSAIVTVTTCNCSQELSQSLSSSHMKNNEAQGRTFNSSRQFNEAFAKYVQLCGSWPV